MGTKIKVQGINVQFPWSELIVNGSKKVETRSYPIPKHLIDVDLALIETNRPNKEPAKIVGLIRFSSCHQYKNEDEWRGEYNLHCVKPDDENYKFNPDKPKWGWVVSKVKKISPPQPAPAKKGIKYAKECIVEI